jgi:hypothetical protein
VREVDTQLYSIGIFEPFEFRSRTPEELNGPTLLNEMTELTGGRAFSVENLNDLPDIAAKIGAELPNQYILGYHPSKSRSRRPLAQDQDQGTGRQGPSASQRLSKDGLLRPSL